MKRKLLLLMCSIQRAYHSLKHSRATTDERGFGMNELLGIAAALIVAGFVIIPGLKSFAELIIGTMRTWWTDEVSKKIFTPIT